MYKTDSQFAGSTLAETVIIIATCTQNTKARELGSFIFMRGLKKAGKGDVGKQEFMQCLVVAMYYNMVIAHSTDSTDSHNSTSYSAL